MKEPSQQIMEGVRGRVYCLLEQCGQQSYDYTHVPNVAKYCIALAERRGLNVRVAELIGLLHDIARVSRAYFVGSHAIAGADIAVKWLEEHRMESDVIDTVTEAIRYHNKKKRIGSVYAELIRDSDSLAHKDEFAGCLPKYERARCELALLAPLSIEPYAAKPGVLLSEAVKRISERLTGNTEEMYSESSVHRLRIDIRSARSVIWLVDGNATAHIAALDAELKWFFKTLGHARKLAVYKKSMQSAGVSARVLDVISNLLRKEQARIAAYARDRSGLLPEVEKTLEANLLGNEEAVAVADKQSQYYSTVQMTDAADIATVHQLRVAGKKIKHLCGLGALSVTEPTDIGLINDYHDTAGKLQDIRENRLLMRKYEAEGLLHLSEREKESLLNMYAFDEEVLNKQVKFLLFKLKKRCCKLPGEKKRM